MYMTKRRLILHIDVNSAYLSWDACYRLQHGEKLDLREVPSAVGGNPKNRHGIILAKSIPAKKYNITTGETLYSALKKCPDLVVVPPRYDLYMRCSNAMVDILKEYSSSVQRFSIDECFLDLTYSNSNISDIELAKQIKTRIRDTLGFTVNIGISTNKLLAKMASDFEKPDKVHTLYPEEIQEKMWPLPVEDLFMVGRSTAPKLRALNINSIGDLANYNLEILRYEFKSFGKTLWNYANGIENSSVLSESHTTMKSLGNSTTIPYDIKCKEEAYKIILSLVETVSLRLRNSENLCSVVSLNIKNTSFMSYSKQIKLFTPVDSTMKIFDTCCQLLDKLWIGEPIRHIGVHVSDLRSNSAYQISFFDEEQVEKSKNLDKAIDGIRERFGDYSIVRGVFVNSGVKPLSGGVGEDEYTFMSSIL
ncbi:DNA polymerase IV [Clostridium manihotivorum]|uniref:DNA polymerase IV n=2 Tax=Clostridium manihotivorum TaxID=2320868 RepID=A0A410E1A2_9CLOT|nr:DNA polymerase IV [Clostridium manihotivorum]QAA35083.1 DNA polymerase IV [Clostridium manihotivorum]